LTAWSGLMIGAFARAHQALGRPQDLAAAEAQRVDKKVHARAVQQSLPEAVQEQGRRKKDQAARPDLGVKSLPYSLHF